MAELNKSLNTLKKINALAHHKFDKFEKLKKAPSLDYLELPPQLEQAIKELDEKTLKRQQK